MSENSLVNLMLSHQVTFPWRSMSNFQHRTEVKVTSNRVDVVYFEQLNASGIGFIAAVEAKLHDWRKAIRQAHRNKLFADRVYVAMPTQYASAAIENISVFRQASIGLILVDNERSRIYYHPPMNTQRSSKHVIKVKQTLASQNN